MSVYPDISHHRKPSGGSKSSEKTSYIDALSKHLSHQKYALLSLKWRYS